MLRGKPYSADEDAKLKELFSKRLSAKAIAATLGRTHSSILYRIHILGLRTWKTAAWSPAEERQLEALWSTNIADIEIATILNRTVSAVRKRIFDLGLKRDSRKARLARRYGMEILADGRDPAAIIAEMRERQEQERVALNSQHEAMVSALLDEMERGINAGCDRAFMFTAALVGGATLNQIGERIGITRERVRQVIEERRDKLGAQQCSI